MKALMHSVTTTEDVGGTVVESISKTSFDLKDTLKTALLAMMPRWIGAQMREFQIEPHEKSLNVQDNIASLPLILYSYSTTDSQIHLITVAGAKTSQNIGHLASTPMTKRECPLSHVIPAAAVGSASVKTMAPHLPSLPNDLT